MKPAQGHSALSLLGCLLLSVSLDLHQKKKYYSDTDECLRYSKPEPQLCTLLAMNLLQCQQADHSPKKDITPRSHQTNAWLTEARNVEVLVEALTYHFF